MARRRCRSPWLPLLAVAAAGAFALQRPSAAARLVERGTIRLGEGADAVALSGEGHCIAVADNQNHRVKLLEARAMPSGGGKEVPLTSLPVKQTLTGFQQPLLTLAFSPNA